jgi:hypothetical protein
VAGLGSGVTEAVLVVTPAEVCKIRLQAQFHSMADPVQLANRKYQVRPSAPLDRLSVNVREASERFLGL